MTFRLLAVVSTEAQKVQVLRASQKKAEKGGFKEPVLKVITLWLRIVVATKTQRFKS